MRIKRVPIRPEMIVNFLIKRNIPMEIIKGLPEDSKFLRAYYDANRDLYYLIIESQEFEEVLKGAAMSEFLPTFKITHEEDAKSVKANKSELNNQEKGENHSVTSPDIHSEIKSEVDEDYGK